MAAAINAQSSATGVTATANANTFVGTNFTAFTASQKANLYINGVQIAISTTSTTGAKAADVVSAINAYAGSTGVVASDNGQGLTLTAQDGRNLELGIGTAGGFTLTAANLGLSPSVATIGNSGTSGYTAIATAVDSLASASYASTYYTGVTLSSQTNFTITAGSKGSSPTVNALVDLNALGFQAGTYGGSNNGTSISQINIGTVAGSQTAMTAIDAALSTISNQRSNLGAVQNRLQAAIDNLTSSNTNLQTAQGRIQDTDYAATTTAMSRAQIISQAATAMLAQANQQPQLVLSLLK
jgi:flagellin